jgi:surface protein
MANNRYGLRTWRGAVAPRVTLPEPDEWQRPSDWLAMPEVGSTEQKFVGLHAVFPEGDNVVAFLFRGAYTVDWGDGTVENVADNVKAEHQYTFASIPADTTTSQGYRQVIITVTPNGGNLTLCSLQQRYTGRNQGYSTGFLDISLSMPNATSIGLGGTTVTNSFAENVNLINIGSITSCNNFFYNFQQIRNIKLFNTSSITNMVGMFTNCYSLQSVPLFNTNSVTNMAGMFQNCYSLKTVPLFNTSSVINMSGMFASCFSLQSVPLFNTSSVINMSNMFQTCIALKEIPTLSTISITTTSGSDFFNFASSNFSSGKCMIIFSRTVSFSNSGFGAPAIVEIFNNLVDRTGIASATITITGNRGASLLTAGERAIATGKNWVITG